MRALLLSLLLMRVLLMPVTAEALELTGRYGYAGEWAAAAALAETQAARSRSERDFTGPINLKHLAICGPGEVAEKSGSLSLRLDGKRYAATLTIGEDSCAVAGTLSEDSVAFADCGKTGRIPLRLWLK